MTLPICIKCYDTSTGAISGVRVWIGDHKTNETIAEGTTNENGEFHSTCDAKWTAADAMLRARKKGWIPDSRYPVFIDFEEGLVLNVQMHHDMLLDGSWSSSSLYIKQEIKKGAEVLKALKKPARKMKPPKKGKPIKPLKGRRILG